jgi:hypothetical protein
VGLPGQQRPSERLRATPRRWPNKCGGGHLRKNVLGERKQVFGRAGERLRARAKSGHLLTRGATRSLILPALLDHSPIAQRSWRWAKPACLTSAKAASPSNRSSVMDRWHLQAALIAPVAVHVPR